MDESSSKACIIIPARFRSSRFPGKPLAKIRGKEMILWVAELSSKAIGKSNVFVATDDERIANIIEINGYNSIMTSENALTGTDRLAEASKKLNYEIIINVQGDEPLVSPGDIKKCLELKIKNQDKIINGFSWIKNIHLAEDINIPKVITNEKNEMIYMSRKALPGTKNSYKKPQKFKKQVCIYALSPDELKLFSEFGRKSYLEEYEDIELLRFLELDKKIIMYECSEDSLAVDIPSDIKKVENYLDCRDDNN